MKPHFIFLVLLSVASICSASMLFLERPTKSSSLRSKAPLTIDFKWGEGSEAGTPGTATHK
jgi:hypothetical protein